MPSDPVEATLAAWGAIGLVHADDPAALEPALQIARRHLAALGRACDRRSARAEVHRMPCAAGASVAVSPLLARVVQASLEIAAQTGGLVDPTVRVARPGSGGAMILVCGKRSQVRTGCGWRTVQLRGARLSVPAGATLELRPCALGVGLDDIALVASRLTGSDVRVQLGGRAASVGHGHVVSDPRHVVDPRTGRPAPATWARVEVSASTCRTAGGQAVAAAVLGEEAVGWLGRQHANARLTRPDGSVVRVGSFQPVTLRRMQAA